MVNDVPEREYFMKTEHLGFGIWTEDDLEIAKELWGDPKVTEFITLKGVMTEEDIKKRLFDEVKRGKEFDVQYWPIFLLETGENVGCCGVRPYDFSKGIYEIGFHIRSKFWKQGFATEAANAVIVHAFQKLGAKKLFAGHNPKNTGSPFVLKKLGFRYTHDEFYEPTGLMHPSYVLDKNDFLELNAK